MTATSATDIARERLRSARQMADPTRDRECFCTGACKGDPTNCPFLTAPYPTLDEAVEFEARGLELWRDRPDAAAELRRLHREGGG